MRPSGSNRRYLEPRDFSGVSSYKTVTVKSNRGNPGHEPMKVIEHLLKLQEIEFGPLPDTPESLQQASALRAEVPPPLLAHYDRLKGRGKKGVAVVDHGVCGGCRMRIPSGLHAALIRDEDIATCDYCARYLILAPPPPPPPPKAVRRPRKKAADALIAA